MQAKKLIKRLIILYTMDLVIWIGTPSLSLWSQSMTRFFKFVRKRCNVNVVDGFVGLFKRAQAQGSKFLAELQCS